jgi:hypothetical protein
MARARCDAVHVFFLSLLALTSVASASADAPVSLFPGVARLAGTNGTAWRASAVLHNPTASPQDALLELLPRDTGTVSVSQPITLAPGETREIANLYDFLGAGDGAGMLRVTGSVVTWVRSYNEGSGTFGQDLPVIPAGGGFSSIEQRVFPISTPADIKREFRSNLMIVNPDTSDITVTMTVGAVTATKGVPAGAYVQINNLGAFLGLPAGVAAVTVSASGPWYAAVATIDPFTGDPTTVRGLSPSDVGPRDFPGIAQIAGVNGAAWRSEAVLANPGPTDVSVQLDVIPRGSGQPAATRSVTLGPAETRRIANLYDFVGVANGAGTLRVTGDALAWVRSYNQRPHAGDTAMETFGQDLPPVGRENVVDPGAFVVLPFEAPASVASGFRSNLVLLNLEDRDITVSLRAGAITKTQAVPAGSYVQIDKLGAFLGVPIGVSSVWATADGRWSTAMATIDPTTNDPTTFRAVEGLRSPSSYDLIDQALADGAINSEQALTYKVFADFADSRLPAQYAGDDRGRFEPSAPREAGERFDSLSPATQNLVGPYLVPAYFKGSWWDLRHGGAAGVGASLASVRQADVPCFPWIGNCPINFSAWAYAASAHVRVWYEVDRAASDRSLADDIAFEVDARIWLPLTNLMGRAPLLTSYGDGTHVDILLSDLSGSDYSGLAVGLGCKTNAAYVLIDRRLYPRSRVYAVVTHELMHAIQDSFETGSCHSTYKWLAESTATWAMDYVYPGDDKSDGPDWEQADLAEYLSHTDRSLEDKKTDGRLYGSYVFFFYLTRIRGMDPLVIRYIWEAARNGDEVTALKAGIEKASGKLDEIWPDFAVYNVNEAPFDDYRVKDRIGSKAVGQRWSGLSASGGDRFAELDGRSDVELPHLSIRYFRFDSDESDDKVSLVTVYNGLTRALDRVQVEDYGEAFSAHEVSDPDAVKGAHIDVLFRIDGKWQREKLTDKPAHSLCRDLKRERFDSLIVILSNSDMSTSHTITPPGRYGPGLFVSNVGCAAWQGDANLTYQWGDQVTEHMVVSGVRFDFVADGYNDEDTLLFRAYTTTAGTFSWAISGTDQGCAYTGQVNGSSLIDPLNAFQTLSYVAGGLGHRGLITGLFYPWVIQPVMAHYTCTPSGSGDTLWSGTEFFLATIPDDAWGKVSSDGKRITINAAQTRLYEGLTGNWTLQAVREP